MTLAAKPSEKSIQLRLFENDAMAADSFSNRSISSDIARIATLYSNPDPGHYLLFLK